MTLLAAVMVALAPAAPAELPPGCSHVHRSTVAYQRVRALIHHYQPTIDRRRVSHYVRCTTTRPKARAVARRARKHRAWRTTYRPRWRIAYNRMPSWDRQWAVSTGACESGNDPTKATGNGYYGAHQWLPETWAAADHTGMWVTATSWHHQAVVAVRWRNIAGAGQWPNCG